MADEQNKSGAPAGGNPAAATMAIKTAPAEAPPPQPSSNRRFIVIGVILLLVLGAVFFYWRSTFTEDTDDAQVDGNLYQVSSRITGHVVKVYVDDNQTVQAGELLAEIDPTDYQVALDQAEADLANAQAQYAQATTNVPITQHHGHHQCHHFGLRCEGIGRHGGAGREAGGCRHRARR